MIRRFRIARRWIGRVAAFVVVARAAVDILFIVFRSSHFPMCLGAFHPCRPSEPALARFFLRGLFKRVRMVLFAMLPQLLCAQEATVAPPVIEATALMDQQQWLKALQVLDAAVKRADLRRSGADAGEIWYQKGICETKLGKHAEAIKSFATCYMDFVPGKDGSGNRWHKLALLRGGDAALAAEQYDLALRQYMKFLAERGKENYSRGSFHINVGICYFKLGKLAEGMENLEIAMKNKEIFPTPQAGIIAGFQAFVAAAIAKNDEQSLLDFVAKNRADFPGEPFEMQEFQRLILKLAQDALAVGMERAAIQLHQMVAATGVTVDDVKARLAPMGGQGIIEDGGRVFNAGDLKKAAEELSAANRGSANAEVAQLRDIAGIHERNGNLRGAMAAYECLELYYPQNGQREAHLFQLIRTCSLVGNLSSVEKYAQVFETVFPTSLQLAAVRKITLTTLFREGAYQKCAALAGPWLEKLDRASDLHDTCLHLLGGSYFYLGMNRQAQPLLDQHVDSFPQSAWHAQAFYFQASNLTKIQEFDKAAMLFDQYLARLPGGKPDSLLPFALLDRATCHFAAREYTKALAMLDRLENEFPQSAVIEMACNMKGNVFLAMARKQQAENCYKAGFERAEKRGMKIVAGESVFLLVAMLGDSGEPDAPNSRLKDAVPWIDRFWKDYAAASNFCPQVAIAGVHALAAVGRGEEGMKHLRDAIVAMSLDPSAVDLQKAIRRYAGIYLTNHSSAELRSHFYAFPGLREQTTGARSLLRMALIEVYEDAATRSSNADEKKDADEQLRSLFSDLKTDFSPKDLAPFILISLGDFIREKTSAPREALAYYVEVLSRPDSSYACEALYGRADVYGRGKVQAELEKGIADLGELDQKSVDSFLLEKALRRKIELLAIAGEWKRVAENAMQYLSRFASHAGADADGVSLLLAQSHEKNDKIDDAIPLYEALGFSRRSKQIRCSSLACRKWMQLLWQRDQPAADGKPGDRQAAYSGGFRYLEATREQVPRMSDTERESRDAVAELVKDFAASPGIAPMVAPNQSNKQED